MSRLDPPMYVRIPTHLKAEIEKSASANYRSFSGEIVLRLSQSYGLEPAAPVETRGRPRKAEPESESEPVAPQPAPAKAEKKPAARRLVRRPVRS